MVKIFESFRRGLENVPGFGYKGLPQQMPSLGKDKLILLDSAKKTKNVLDSYLLICSTPSFTHLLSDMWVLRRGDMCHTKLLCQAQASEMRRGQEAGAICWLSPTICYNLLQSPTMCYNLLQSATATLCEATILLLASVKTHTGWMAKSTLQYTHFKYPKWTKVPTRKPSTPKCSNVCTMCLSHCR